MGFLFRLLTMPFLGGPMLVRWTANTLVEQAEREATDETGVRRALVELAHRYDQGDIEEGDYDRQEAALLATLASIRKTKAAHGGDS